MLGPGTSLKEIASVISPVISLNVSEGQCYQEQAGDHASKQAQRSVYVQLDKNSNPATSVDAFNKSFDKIEKKNNGL
jgi:hypothetical protein